MMAKRRHGSSSPCPGRHNLSSTAGNSRLPRQKEGGTENPRSNCRVLCVCVCMCVCECVCACVCIVCVRACVYVCVSHNDIVASHTLSSREYSLEFEITHTHTHLPSTGTERAYLSPGPLKYKLRPLSGTPQGGTCTTPPSTTLRTELHRRKAHTRILLTC